MKKLDETQISRRALLKGGAALVVMASVPGSVLSSTAKLVEAADDWPSPDATQLDTWLAVHADGTVTMFTGKLEIGNGAMTGLMQIVAEELDISFEKLNVVMGDTALTIDQGAEVGSSCIVRAGPQMRQIAANARYVLNQMAAAALNTTPDKLAVKDGVAFLRSDPTKSVSYATLVGDKQFNTKIPTTGGNGTPKSPSQYNIVGTNITRRDITEKVSASFTYVHDLKIPGMLHGRVIRPSGIGSSLLSVGAAPKGVQVVQKNNFLGVVSQSEWLAVKAAKTLKVQWSDWNGVPASASAVYDAVRNAPVTNKVVAGTGNVPQALAGAAKVVNATYLTPFESHASLGPSCAIADVRNGEAIIYSGTTSAHGLRSSVATLLNLPINKVHVIFYEASGDYGNNGADPCAIDAALLSASVGAPVRVQWMRWDETGWDPKGPAMVQDIHGGFDAAGNLIAWNHETWAPPTGTSTLIGSVLAGGPVVGQEAIGSWAGPLLYNFSNDQQLLHAEVDLGGHDNGAQGIITAHLRSPAQHQITFAMESFMDEMAAAAGADPVEFRLNYLTDQRTIDLVRAVAEAGGWDTRSSPGPQAQSKSHIVTGRGFAISSRGNTLNAEIAWVTVNKQTGKVTVDRFLVGQDNGLTINPKQVQLQIESGVMQTISRTLYEEVGVNGHNVTSVDWVSYPIARFMDAPTAIDTLLIDHPEFPATGVGEPACCPVAAAMANAIFDATGVRLRQLPLRASRVKAALKAAGVA